LPAPLLGARGQGFFVLYFSLSGSVGRFWVLLLAPASLAQKEGSFALLQYVKELGFYRVPFFEGGLVKAL